MPNQTDKNRGKRPAARVKDRRGTMYDRIAEARAKRERVLCGEGDQVSDIVSNGVAAALRGHSDRPPEPIHKDTSSAHKSVLPELEAQDDVQAPNSVEYVADPESQSNNEAVEFFPDRRRRSSAVLWFISLTVAAFAVGSVLWLSGPASRPLDDAVPILGTIPPAPNVDRFAIAPPAAPGWSDTSGVVLDVAASLSLRANTPSQVSPVLFEPSGLPEYGQAPVASETFVPIAPEQPRPQPRPVLAQAPDTESKIPAPALSSDLEATALSRDLRVILNAPRTVPDTSLAAVIAALAESGADPAPRRVNLTISTSNVRYFHPEDAGAATVIADGIGAQLRDFTDFQPSPPEGLVEIWMAGREIESSGPREGDAFDQIARDLQELQRNLSRILGGN